MILDVAKATHWIRWFGDIETVFKGQFNCPYCKMWSTVMAYLQTVLFAHVNEKNQYDIAKIYENLKNKVEKYYSELNFEGVEECYQKMKFWFYDTSEKEEILEYDKKVYKDAKKYYDTLKKVDDSLNKNSYRSLRSLLNKLEDPTEKFSDLEINKKSKIGQYINNIRTNPAYDAFNSEMVNNDKYNVDDGLVSGGYSVVISVYTSTLLEEEFPYMGGK